MAQSSAAKKSPPKATKSTPPTWSKIEGGKSRSSVRPKARPRAPARAPERAPPIVSTRATKKSAPSARRRSQFKIPAHMRPELVALSMFVVAALFIVGLLTWSSGSQNIVGVAGGVLARLFGVAAWLVPVALIGAAGLLLVGARSHEASRWASPAVPVGLALLLLGAMGLIHLFAAGQPAAELGQGGGYVGLAISTFLSDYLTPFGAGIVLAAVTLVGFMLAFGVSLAVLLRSVGQPTVAAGRFAGQALGGARVRLSQGQATRIPRRSASLFASTGVRSRSKIPLPSHCSIAPILLLSLRLSPTITACLCWAEKKPRPPAPCLSTLIPLNQRLNPSL